ncbi:hypothetical protein ABW06_04690 [Pluralibacter gergoviae]|uniref:Uncharacterized protein n=1 Tax=Pluralibacter gergoviae TaxID=61647 RepID=A0A0J5L9K3_PLUGE|nr:hypothetical protein ABW06_04690 [Pluralibacter gergoviae]KMK25170.1 hypothetical protein ABW10_07545 [Pluralibacter gergoviae]
MRENPEQVKTPLNEDSKKIAIFYKVNIKNIVKKQINVMSITLTFLRLMKDRPMSFLSTDCVTNLGIFCVKIGFSSHVKAVNGNSSGRFPQLSHFSVDNMV